MAVPFYVSPDQIMQDKAEYARKGIAKGRSIVAVEYADGLLLMAVAMLVAFVRKVRASLGPPEGRDEVPPPDTRA